jgi:hypothetical protein
MATEVRRGTTPGGVTPESPGCVWTFVISAGPSFKITLPDNPFLDYKGGREIWKIVAPESTADTIKSMLESLGVVVVRYTEGESLEQTAERRRLLGLDLVR